MKEHWVKSSRFSYPIIIGRGAVTQVGHIIRDKDLIQGKKTALVTSGPIFDIWGDDLVASFTGSGLDVRLIKIPDGEEAKELDTLNRIYTELVHFGLHRDGLIIALGGGTVSDVAGFAASTYLRGVDYINVPTTFLAQVDSCIGGKTGIDHDGGKNLVGTFWQPSRVVIDPDTLATLEPKQVMSGLAEVLKSAVIASDSLFNLVEEKFDSLVTLQDQDAIDEIIERTLLIKAGVIEADEYETRGQRMLLNFGHTFGHAYETLFREQGYPVTHGEAVSLGMITESRLAHLLDMLSETDEKRITLLCRRIADPAALKDLKWDDVQPLLDIDKKARDEGLRFALPTAIGRVNVIGNIDDDLVRKAMEQTSAST